MVRAPKSHEGPLSASSCHSLVKCFAHKYLRGSFGVRWRVLRALPVSCGAASSNFYGPLGDTRSPYEVCRPRGEHPTRGSHIGGPDSFWARFPYSHTLPRTLQNTYHIRINSVIWRPWRLPRDSPILTPSREPSVRHPMNGCPKHGQTKTHTIVSHSDVHQA